MSKKNDSPLGKVQNLYLMQVELWNFLDEKNVNADRMKSAKKTLKEFKELLSQVDWRLMGGEDVLESLQHIPTEVHAKLKKAPKKAAAKSSVSKKVAKKTVKKKK